MLVNKQINELYRIVVTHQLSPTDFMLSGTSDSYDIKLRNSWFNFIITKLRSGYALNTTPNVTHLHGGTGIIHDSKEHAYLWNGVLSHFDEWVQLLAENSATPSLWPNSLQTSFEEIEEVFTDADLQELRNKLNLIKSNLSSSIILPEEAIKQLTVIVREAFQKSENTTKSAFDGWFTQAIIAAIINLALNPSQAQEVLRIVRAAFGGLFLH